MLVVIFSDGPQGQRTYFGKGGFPELRVLSQNENKNVHRRQFGGGALKEMIQEGKLCFKIQIYYNFPKEEALFNNSCISELGTSGRSCWI